MHAVAQLLTLLSTPPGDGPQDAGQQIQRRNALWLNWLMVLPAPDQKTLVESKISGWDNLLPVEMQPPVADAAPAFSVGSASPTVLSWWPIQYARGQADGWRSPGLVLLDDTLAADESVCLAQLPMRQ